MGVQQRVAPAAMTGGWGVAEAEDRLRRALLRASRDDAVLQDRIDCAELAAVCGLRDVAAAVYGVVFLQLGFSAGDLALQEQLDERTGLWGGLSGPGTGSERGQEQQSGFSVDRAISELRALMRFKPALRDQPGGIKALLPPDALSPMPPASPQGAGERLAQLCGRAVAGLREVPHAAREDRLGELLRGLADEVAAGGPIRLEDHLDQDTVRLASLFALEGLRRFLVVNHDLLHALPAGSPLFDEAGRLDPAALGPFFANVRMVARDARDAFALIEAAAGQRPGRGEVECWCVLLSAHFPHGEMGELIDELGDRGLAGALRAVLARTIRTSGTNRPHDLALRIRDVSLDIGDLAVAADAQHLAALWARADRNEWVILGEIRAARGDQAGAAEAFSRALPLDPDNRDVLRRLVALRSGKRFEVPKGYGTSVGRYRLRRARMEAYAKGG